MRTRRAGVVLLLAACASSGGGGPRTDRDVITRAQIETMTALDAFEIVQRMRPEYLRQRGQSSLNAVAVLPVVYVDGTKRGGPEVLRDLRTTELDEIRFISAADATTRWGTDHSAGVIEIRTRQGGGRGP